MTTIPLYNLQNNLYRLEILDYQVYLREVYHFYSTIFCVINIYFCEYYALCTFITK